MKFGMNLLLWTAELNDGILPVLENIKAWGYDGVEVPLFNYDLNYAAWGRRFDDLGLARTAVTVRTAADNPISPDQTVRRRGVDANRHAIDCCQALGATHLVGPYHSALGEFTGRGPTDAEWRWGVESMRQSAEHAGQGGIVLAIEYLNRFETYLLNSATDTARFVREVNHPSFKMMYDTFHANIEEKDSGAAIRQAGELIVHVHISENDRSTPGQGQVAWDANFDALREIHYDGWMVVEAFGLALPELAAATKIWRRMYHDEAQLCRDAINFMKREVARRW